MTSVDFHIFPAIDLKGGQVVRLREGLMDQATVFANDPTLPAADFMKAGAEWLHIVDLDGAFAGHAVNAGAVEAILGTFTGKTQVGGGIRDMDAIDRWLGLGVTRVIIGTAALKNPDLVKQAAKKYPNQIVVAVDAKDGMVATDGWAAVSDVTIAELARRFEDAGVAAVLFTDVGRDGLLKGVNLEATVKLAEETTLPVIASGGVADISDIKALVKAAGETTGKLEGVITGRAIYDGRLKLEDALQLAKKAA